MKFLKFYHLLVDFLFGVVFFSQRVDPLVAALETFEWIGQIDNKRCWIGLHGKSWLPVDVWVLLLENFYFIFVF